MRISNITFIGAGNVTDSLAYAFHRSGLRINRIITRRPERSRDLAEDLGCEVTDLVDIPDDTDVVVIAVPDNAIANVINSLRADINGVIVIHTSGSTSIDLFTSSFPSYGVLYPLQTFSKGDRVDCRGLYFFTEASDSKTHMAIDYLVTRIGGVVQHLKSRERELLHASAVFICNFVNHMVFAGTEIAAVAGVEREVFSPLIKETIRKVIAKGAVEAQTGPAIRRDNSTIEKHLALLEERPEIRDIYEVVTRSIIMNSETKGNHE